MLLLEKLAEHKIKSALDAGEFEGLAGAGKPLVLEDDSHIPVELRASFKIPKNGGYVPPEITLMSEIKHVESLLLLVNNQGEKSDLVTRLSLLKSKMAERKNALI